MERKFFYLSLILAAMMMMGCNNSNTPKQSEEVTETKVVNTTAETTTKEVTETKVVNTTAETTTKEVTIEKKTITGTVKRVSIILDEHIFVLNEYPGIELKVLYKRCPEATYLQTGDVVTVTFPVKSGRFREIEKLDIHNFDI